MLCFTWIEGKPNGISMYDVLGLQDLEHWIKPDLDPHLFPGGRIEGTTVIRVTLKTLAYIGLGSNLGASSRTLLEAWEALGFHEAIELIELSRPYLSAPVGMISENWFTNAVGVLETEMSPLQLLQALLHTEKAYGRQRDQTVEGYQDRTVDLDLLYFGDTVQSDPELTIPHPRRAERLFVMEPMASIAPNFVDPLENVTIGTLHQQLLTSIAQGVIEKQEIKRAEW